MRGGINLRGSPRSRSVMEAVLERIEWNQNKMRLALSGRRLSLIYFCPSHRRPTTLGEMRQHVTNFWWYVKTPPPPLVYYNIVVVIRQSRRSRVYFGSGSIVKVLLAGWPDRHSFSMSPPPPFAWRMTVTAGCNRWLIFFFSLW